MAKLFIGYVEFDLLWPFAETCGDRGLAWHTNDETLRHRFQDFGTVEEAVRSS